MFELYIFKIKVLFSLMLSWLLGLSLVLIGFVVLYIFYLKNRKKSLKLRMIFEKIMNKRGGKISGGKYVGYPAYEFTYRDAQVQVRKGSTYGGEEGAVDTIIQIKAERRLGCFFVISGRMGATLKKAASFLSNIIKSSNSIEVPGFSSEDLRVSGEDPILVNSILTDEIKAKLININRKFTFFRLHIEDTLFLCSIRGMPETAEDMDILLDTVECIYDRIRETGVGLKKDLESKREKSIGYKGIKSLEETFRYKMPISLFLVGCFYIISGLIGGLFFGNLFLKNFSENAFLWTLIFLFFTILSFGGLVGGIGVLLFKKWGIAATNCIVTLLIILHIIANWQDVGLMQKLPINLLSMRHSVLFIFIFISIFIFYSFWIFSKRRIKKLFD